MAETTTESIGRGIESLFDGSSVAGLSDRQLLERYTVARDRAGEAAFAALVARFGPMVSGVCRQLLRDHHDAEDAFQAVFLVLARRAPSIRDPDLLANWLYGVALRTARCANLQIDRRRKKEAGEMGRQDPGASALVEPIVPPADARALDLEQSEALHREIGRLPRSFRVPVVLCYFEGLTLDEAARRLRCPAGTLRSRLARAREKLRRALVRRGVVFPAAALAAALESSTTRASVSSTLCNIATRSAIEFAAGKAVSSSATALAQIVLRLAFVGQLRVAALSLLLVACGVAGVSFVAGAWAIDDEPKISRVGRIVLVAEKQDDAKQKPGPGRMFVVGRVLDPNGRPVPDATVMASARAKFAERAFGVGAQTVSVLGQANADKFGRFRVEAPRTSSSRNDEFMAIALSPGHGVGWAKIDPDADQPAADISLQLEQIIEGRLFDVNGRPAQGVTVSVAWIVRVVNRDSRVLIPGSPRGEGPIYWWTYVNDKPAWPKPATTDADGRFTIHGVGRGFETRLGIIDPRFALQYVDVETNDFPGAKVVTTSLQPAKILAGRVTYADTGEPASQAVVRIGSRSGGRPVPSGPGPIMIQTDAGGRFRANPLPGEVFTLTATPPLGRPYLAVRKRVEWPKGAVEQSVEFALPRGVSIRGKVTEEGSARPVAGALVAFMSHARQGANSGRDLNDSVTDADGSFELAAPPGAGYLAIQARSEDYVVAEIGNREFADGEPGGIPLYAHAFVACELKPDAKSPEIGVVLRRGAAVTGRIIGPDDEPVRDTWIIGRAALRPTPAAWRGWVGNYHGNATSGRFELHGLDPDHEIAVHFFEPKRKLGATAHLSGKSAAGGPITIRLEPCGTAVARLVDSRHRPVARFRADRFAGAMLSIIVTPGPSFASSDPADAGRINSAGATLGVVDPVNYAKEPLSDAQGRIAFPALIPGASYRIVGLPTASDPSGTHFRPDFTVKPGETLDLGEIPIEKPQ